MMAPASTARHDPRSYVQVKSLPIPTQKGLKLQARSETVYNPTTPTREEVFRENYGRRLKQTTRQGYRSRIDKPYQELGGPIHLDERKLILSALGQLKEQEAVDRALADKRREEEQEREQQLLKDAEEQIQQQQRRTAAQFVLRKQKKELNSLNSQFKKQRSLMQSVRLGKGLFRLMNDEEAAHEDAQAEQTRRQEMEKLSSWQPPTAGSSSDEEDSDDDLSKDEDLGKFFQTEVPEGSSSRTKSAATSHAGTIDIAAQSEFAPSVRTRSAVSTKKKKGPHSAPPRPFTPCYSNINAHQPATPIELESFFRQLCALNWILESMSLEGPSVMMPISSCWDLKEPGGTKTTQQKLKKEKMTETKWAQFISQPRIDRQTRLSIRLAAGSRRPSSARKVSIARSPSVSSRPGSHSSGRVSPGPPSPSPVPPTPPTPTVTTSPVTAPDIVVSEDVPEADEVDEVYDKALLKFLSDISADLQKEAEEGLAQDGDLRPGSAEDSASRRDTPTITINSPRAVDRMSMQTVGRGARAMMALRKQSRAYGMPGSARNPSPTDEVRSQLADYRLRGTPSTPSTKSLPARPLSSPAYFALYMDFPSVRQQGMPLEMKQRFADVTAEKSLTLHDNLEALDRKRKQKCETKFRTLGHPTSFFRAVDKMKTAVQEEERREQEEYENLRRQKVHAPWYKDLQENLPPNIRDDRFCLNILEKISRYGIFVREKIIEMPTEDYEEWLDTRLQTRAKSAPPGGKR
ncbi:PREDICTED: coiled-coil domain-containing protein 60-like [Branchiostoma belcheri]|uniref:Coiled-coil domain-containing protein 60-like n=1 Tax=Branchiostoma belcheri TaxID=7741 RepID=A0A6P4ZFK1_BRABE|nr:PREDICTED: coiled-coil domain-containing protein 60-like [Branchiostoma belcheri]